MNKQKKANGGRGIEWTDYTWNPIAGCFHACQWTMPDGTIANCYAEDVADRLAQAAYPNGFEFDYWHPEILQEPIQQKRPSRIFVGSMADVFGHWVAKDHVLQVLDVCAQAPWHTFQFLTKNPVKAREFAEHIPPNCWIGASTPPNFMWNKPLKGHQRAAMFSRTLDALGTLHERGLTTWLSAEPLTINAADYLKVTPVVDWVVIGAASNGKLQYAPDETLVRELVDACDSMGAKVFFKGNLKSLPWAAAHWREDFPAQKAVAE